MRPPGPTRRGKSKDAVYCKRCDLMVKIRKTTDRWTILFCGHAIKSKTSKQLELKL